MIKTVAIDTEYNSSKDPLSIGITNQDNELCEFFIKNSVDRRTFDIHGIATSYLSIQNEFYLIKKDIHEKIISSDYIIGFDIEQDFIVLNLKQYFSLFDKKRVIDLKHIFSFIGINTSLTKIAGMFNLNEELMTKLSPHSASYDSIISHKLLDKVVELGITSGYTKEVILNELAEISKYIFNKEMYELELTNSCLSWLKQFCKNEPIQTHIKKPHFFSKGENVTIMDENLLIICRFPVIHLNEESLIGLKEKDEDKEYNSIGIRYSKHFVNDYCVLFNH